jgi:hypothetical protein
MSVVTRPLRREALDSQGIGRRLVLRTALIALAVSAAYYLGTATGQRARFPARALL